MLTQSASARGFGFGDGLGPPVGEASMGFKGMGMNKEIRTEMRTQMQARHEYLASLTPEQRAQELEKMWQERETQRNQNQSAWQEFTGLTQEQIEERRDNGETMGEILQSQGKTTDQTQTFLETQGNKRVDFMSQKFELAAETVQKMRDNVVTWAQKMVSRWFGTTN